MNIVRKVSQLVNRHGNLKKLCHANYINEEQAKEALSFNPDMNIFQLLSELQNNPDCKYLASRLTPSEKDVIADKHLNPKDVVKATVLGDIIGSKYEFVPHNYSKARTIPLPPVSARYTDDTVLSIATMNAILKDDKKPDFAHEYRMAYRAHPHAGFGGSFASWALGNSNQGYNSMANGSIMRVSFIAAYYDDINDVIKHTIESAMVTHNHVEGVKGAVVMAVSIWMALHGYTKQEIWKYCKKHYYIVDKNLLLNKKYYFDLTQHLSDVKLAPNRNTLFCGFVVPYIIKCFCETNSYEECMREILTRFGDTDTICAAAGGLCYAYYCDTGFDVDNILSQHSVII